MSTLTPSTRSLRKLEAEGWTVDTVERRVGPVTHDLFGFIDLLAVRGDTTLAVQVTTSSNLAARIKKIADAATLPAVREAGWRIEGHGWFYSKRSRLWQCRVVDIS